MQTLAETQGHFQHALVAIKLDDVSRPVQYCRAAFASPKMFLHGRAQSRINLAIEEIRYLAPYLCALHYHGLFPFAKASALLQLPPRPGASRSRSIRRALSKRVLTDGTEMPNALAVSSMLNCCMSRRIKTSRYFCPRELNASASFCRTSARSSVSEGISRQSAKSRGVY